MTPERQAVVMEQQAFEIQRLTAALANRDAQIADMDAELEEHATDRVNQRAEVEKLRAALAEAEKRADANFKYIPQRVEQLVATLTQERDTLAQMTRNGVGMVQQAEQERDAAISRAKQEILRESNYRYAEKARADEAEERLAGVERELGAAKYYAEINADPIARYDAILTSWSDLKERHKQAESRADTENSKLSGVMTRWHEEIARRERAEEALAQSKEPV